MGGAGYQAGGLVVAAVAVLLVLMAAVGILHKRGTEGGGLCCSPAAGTRASREQYLVHPYTDLDSPGERGSPYALAECA